MTDISKPEKEIMEYILKENNLNNNSILYRFTSERYLKKNADGTEVLIVNEEPQEMVVDTYKGQGHVFVAKDIGPGLSFLTEPFVEYERNDRVCVSVKISELLAKGGLIYKVISLPAYITAYFFTVPNNEVPIIRK